MAILLGPCTCGTASLARLSASLRPWCRSANGTTRPHRRNPSPAAVTVYGTPPRRGRFGHFTASSPQATAAGPRPFWSVRKCTAGQPPPTTGVLVISSLHCSSSSRAVNVLGGMCSGDAEISLKLRLPSIPPSLYALSTELHKWWFRRKSIEPVSVHSIEMPCQAWSV